MSLFVTSAIAIMSKDNALCIRCIIRILESVGERDISKQKASLCYKLCSIVGPTKFTSCTILLIKDIMYTQNVKYFGYNFMNVYNVNEDNLHMFIEEARATKDILHLDRLVHLEEVFINHFTEILPVRRSLKETFLDNFNGYNEIWDKTSFIESFRNHLKLRLENGCYYILDNIFAFAKELDIWCDTNYVDIVKEHGLQHYYASLDMKDSINPILDVPDIKRTRFINIFNGI